jgi:hypothetical protein
MGKQSGIYLLELCHGRKDYIKVGMSLDIKKRLEGLSHQTGWRVKAVTIFVPALKNTALRKAHILGLEQKTLAKLNEWAENEPHREVLKVDGHFGDGHTEMFAGKIVNMIEALNTTVLASNTAGAFWFVSHDLRIQRFLYFVSQGKINLDPEYQYTAKDLDPFCDLEWTDKFLADSDNGKPRKHRRSTVEHTGFFDPSDQEGMNAEDLVF